jgi:preprotein translocase subunit YajC
MNLLDESKQVQPEQIDYVRTVGMLKPGTKVLLSNGQVAEFVEMKRTNFTGIINGKRYRIPATAFVKVIDASNTDNFDSIIEKKQPQIQDIKDKQKLLNSLKKGDYFYINSGKRQNAELYIFQEIRGKKVIGQNPITNDRVRIDMSFNYYKLK